MIGDINLHNAADYTHRNEQVDSANGAHGLRYQNNTLQYYSSNQWNTISGGGSPLYYYVVQLPASSSNALITMHIISKINKSVMSSAAAVSGFISGFGDFTSGNFIVLPKLSDTIDMRTGSPYMKIETRSNFSFSSTLNGKIRAQYRYQATNLPDSLLDTNYTSDYTTYQIVSKQTLN